MLPIDKIEFWDDRIKRADELGDIHHSVYISRTQLWREIEKVHFDILKREIDSNMKVLDGGCGYGRCSTIFPPQKYTGVDFSPHFIELAREKYPSYTFDVGNLKNLPYKDSAFDVAFCISMEQMVKGNLGEDEWWSMLKELQRVANKVIVLEYENPQIYDIY